MSTECVASIMFLEKYVYLLVYVYNKMFYTIPRQLYRSTQTLEASPHATENQNQVKKLNDDVNKSFLINQLANQE